jgi:hypothetical protein
LAINVHITLMPSTVWRVLRLLGKKKDFSKETVGCRRYYGLTTLHRSLALRCLFICLLPVLTQDSVIVLVGGLGIIVKRGNVTLSTMKGGKVRNLMTSLRCLHLTTYSRWRLLSCDLQRLFHNLQSLDWVQTTVSVKELALRRLRSVNDKKITDDKLIFELSVIYLITLSLGQIL